MRKASAAHGALHDRAALEKIEGGLRAVQANAGTAGQEPAQRRPRRHGRRRARRLWLLAQGCDLLAQLLELNLAVAARIDNDQPVTAPGLPPSFPDPTRLITDDCIRP